MKISEILAKAQAQLQGAKAQIAHTDYRIEQASIRAPVAGLIIARNAKLTYTFAWKSFCCCPTSSDIALTRHTQVQKTKIEK